MNRIILIGNGFDLAHRLKTRLVNTREYGKANSKSQGQGI